MAFLDIVTAVGIVVDSAIVPMACTVMWRRQSASAVIFSPLICSAAAIAAWLATAYTHYGSVTIATTSESLPLVAGNMMSLCGPLLMTPLITYIKPDNYDWELLKGIKQMDDANEGDASIVEHSDHVAHHNVADEESTDSHQEHNAVLLHARKYALLASVAMTLCYLILWPIPMYGSSYGMSPIVCPRI